MLENLKKIIIDAVEIRICTGTESFLFSEFPTVFDENNYRTIINEINNLSPDFITVRNGKNSNTKYHEWHMLMPLISIPTNMDESIKRPWSNFNRISIDNRSKILCVMKTYGDNITDITAYYQPIGVIFHGDTCTVETIPFNEKLRYESLLFDLGYTPEFSPIEQVLMKTMDSSDETCYQYTIKKLDTESRYFSDAFTYVENLITNYREIIMFHNDLNGTEEYPFMETIFGSWLPVAYVCPVDKNQSQSIKIKREDGIVFIINSDSDKITMTNLPEHCNIFKKCFTDIIPRIQTNSFLSTDMIKSI